MILCVCIGKSVESFSQRAQYHENRKAGKIGQPSSTCKSGGSGRQCKAAEERGRLTLTHASRSAHEARRTRDPDAEPFHCGGETPHHRKKEYLHRKAI
ncbi:hypothetical protein E2C01_082726 [Portunus trituberculatus]|uniref:Uncharacterized protein n=1 Tax=Portunus trituberculatus TaxID=210409 RepID=A0A5B7J2I5_PORTR|nr:hypothetical protein [Portunus trituberculatus]